MESIASLSRWVLSEKLGAKRQVGSQGASKICDLATERIAASQLVRKLLR